MIGLSPPAGAGVREARLVGGLKTFRPESSGLYQGVKIGSLSRSLIGSHLKSMNLCQRWEDCLGLNFPLPYRGREVERVKLHTLPLKERTVG